MEAWARGAGTYAKCISNTPSFDEELDEGRSDSEADSADISYPSAEMGSSTSRMIL